MNSKLFIKIKIYNYKFTIHKLIQIKLLLGQLESISIIFWIEDTCINFPNFVHPC